VVLHAEDNEISRDSKPHRTPRKEVMLVTANARCTEIVVGSLAKSTEGKRRSLVWDTRPGTECTSKRAVPQVSSAASDRWSKAEVIQRAREGDRTGFEYLYRLYSRRVYRGMPTRDRRPDRSRRFNSRGFLAPVPQNSYVSWRIGLFCLAAKAGG
jgi:hypothetical protein